jgi:hypothetical protein
VNWIVPHRLCGGTRFIAPAIPGILLGLVLLLPGCASKPFGKPFQFPDGLRVVMSPDGQMEARVPQVSKGEGLNFENKVEIYQGRGVLNSPDKKAVASANYVSPDGRHGRTILKVAWTGDSQFFVYSTVSSSGEMGWHTATFFYSRKQNEFYHLDNFVGTIVESEFILGDDDTVYTRRLVPGGALDKTEPVTVHLGSFVKVPR